MDCASATPVLSEVKKAMEKYWSGKFENPSAIYAEGVYVRREVENYRKQIAEILGIKKADVVFTSGSTEANNLAILGAFEGARDPFDKTQAIEKPHLIISDKEHPSILEVAKEVERRGGEVSFAETDEYGRVGAETIRALVKPNTFMISVMLANNETGVIQPISKIGREINVWRKEKGSKYPLFHTDASQTPNYLDVNLDRLHVDLLSLDGSKIYGPKGVGILATRISNSLRPIILGGGQERGLRSGTESPALIAGFAVALILANRDREKESKRLYLLRKSFVSELEEKLPEVKILGREPMLPNIVAVELPKRILNELVVLAFDREGIAISGGSSCSNLNDAGNESLIRFSFGRKTTLGEVKGVIKVFSKILTRDNIST